MVSPIRVPIVGIDLTSKAFGSALKGINSFSQKAKRIGTSMTVGVTLPLLAAGTASVLASNQFNSTMANVETLVPGNPARVIELKKNVQDLAIDTGKLTTDIGEGLYQVISAFGDASDTADKLRTNVIAAKAGIATTTDAINLTSAVTKAYGDTSATAVSHVADLAFHTVKLGQTTFPELAASIGRVAPLSKTLGISMEEMFGVMATTTGVVGDTAAAATQFSAILGGLVKPNQTMAQLFEYLGYSSGKAMIAELGFTKSLQKIVEVSNAANVPLGKMFESKEALISMFSLTGAQAGDFSMKLDLVRNSSGKLDEAFKAQTQGINKAGFAFERSKQKMIVIAQEFGDILAPAIARLADFFDPLITGIRNLSPVAKKTLAIFGGSAMVIGPIIALVAGLAAAIAALATTTGLIALAVVWFAAQMALVAAVVIKNWDGIKGFFTGLWNFITKLFNSRIGRFLLLINPLTALPTLIIANWDKVSKFFTKLFGGIKATFSNFGNWIKNFELPDWVKKLINNPVSRWLYGNDQGTAFFANPQASGAPAGAAALTSKAAEIQNGTVRKESTVKVEFQNAPPGTRIRQDNGPSMDLNMGFAGVSG